MGSPIHPVTLTPEQVAALNRSLSKMRHDINNSLSLIVATSTLIKLKPSSIDQMTRSLHKQPPKISEALATFIADFEKVLGVTPD
ncbi:MAG: hypothetical protein JXQ71_06845 [Verrucomicrobia bacterium]|nr:hypothetical protein [Verrucomicrobiota bacterium]